MAYLAQLLTEPARYWRIHCARMEGVTLGANCKLQRNVRLDRGPYAGKLGAISVGRESQLEDGVLLQAWGGMIELGENVFVGPYTVMYGHGGITIGAHTLISMQCSILSSNHTVPARDKRIRFEPSELLATRIGSDVWIGAGTRVLGGVTIGDGAVVGAGSVVATDLPAYSVSVGVPARVIRSRE